MDTLENGGRLNKLHLQLLEIIKGHLWHRVERSDKKDEMEALIMIINTITEEFRASIQHEGYINFHDSYVYTMQLLFILDMDYLVLDINKDADKFLGYGKSALLGTSFNSLLTSRSIKEWGQIRKYLETASWEEKPVRLTFRAKNGLLFPAYCFIVPFSYPATFRSGTVITAFEMVRTRKEIEEGIKNKVRAHSLSPKTAVKAVNVLRAHDIEIIQAIGEDLRKHLQERTPLLQELASTYGMNEFKLKNGFKELYGTTIFQYLKEERLKKAHVLVELTNYPFKDITDMVGFKSATHFSREFKARFGYGPRALRNAGRE